MKYLHTADPLFIEKLDKTHQLLEEYDEQVSGQTFCVNTSLGKRDFLFTDSFYETLRIKLSYLQGTLPENVSPLHSQTDQRRSITKSILIERSSENRSRV